MKKKSPKAKSEKFDGYELHRPPNPRQYRPKPSSSRNSVHKPVETIEQTGPLRKGSSDQTLQCIADARREEIIAQIKIDNDYQWGLEAEDFDDLNPYSFEVKQEPEPDGEIGVPSFEWVAIKQEKDETDQLGTESFYEKAKEVVKAEPSEPELPVQIKQEELDLEDIAPYYTLELPSNAISQEEIQTMPPEQPVQIKLEESDLVESEYPNVDMDGYSSSVMEDDSIATIVVDDADESEEDDPEPVHPSDVVPGDAIILNQGEIATICVDDSDDESVNLAESTVGPSEIKPRRLTTVHYKKRLAKLTAANQLTLPVKTGVHYDEHKCIPRRIYPNSFLKRFVKNTTYRGYSVTASRLLNGDRNQFAHIYSCDNCDKLCANAELIRQHVLTHRLKRSVKHPQLFVTAECQICSQRHLDDLFSLREHLDQEHPRKVYRAARGQKFAVRIDCQICRRWFPMNECLECGEEFDRCYGITWHNRIHRQEEKQKIDE